MSRRRPARCADPDLHNRDWWTVPAFPYPPRRLFGLLGPAWAEVLRWHVRLYADQQVNERAIRHAMTCPVYPAYEVDGAGAPAGRRPGWPE